MALPTLAERVGGADAVHVDWPWPLNRVLRTATAFIAPPPKKWIGNAQLESIVWDDGQTYWYPNDIPAQGEWWLGSRFSFAWRTKGRWYFRFMPFGRFTDEPKDKTYWAWPSITIKRYPCSTPA